MPKTKRAMDFTRAERGANYVCVWQKVFKDKQRYMLPVLYVKEGTDQNLKLKRLDALLDYCIDNHKMSQTWLADTVRAVGMLIDFTQAWLPILTTANTHDTLEDSYQEMLMRFAKAVLNGSSFAEDGKNRDSTGLYWRPRSEKSAKTILTRLSAFLASLSLSSDKWNFLDDFETNSAIVGIRFAHRLEMQRKRSLLAHLSSTSASSSHLYRFGRLFSQNIDGLKTYRFPSRYVWKLLFDGFRDETAELIAFILFAAGPRFSEVLHAWVQDVQFIDDKPMFFIHHPRDGVVHDKHGNRTIRVKHLHTQNLVPRNALKKRGHSGFKGMAGEAYGAELIWLPIPGLEGEIAKRLKHYIKVTRPRLMRLRRAKGLPDHNYLFVGSGQTFGPNTNPVGHPYTIEAFKSAWKSAVKRISKLHDDAELTVAKHKGTTIHGARHLYGTILKTIGCDGAVIQRCMHHKSPFSHLRYTELTANEINDVLQRQAGQSHADFSGLFATISEALQRQSE